MNDNVVVNNLCKKYNDFSLDNISFKIKPGHVLGILGENGAGKTTTIKAILNLISIDNGNITIFGLDNIKCERKVKENIGVVLDDSFLPGYYDALDINKLMKNIHDNWDEKKYFNYIDTFKLPRNKMIKYFSKGMYIKIKIAVALSFNPKLLVLDEPTSGLDPIARSDMLNVFTKYIENTNNSILISSHITTDLELLADDIIFIDDGKIILNESRDQLLNDYLIVNCTKDEYNTIDKNDYLRYKENRFGYELLIKRDINFKDKYNINVIENPTLEKIMILYIRGNKNEYNKEIDN